MHWASINERGSLTGMRLVLWIQKWLGAWPLRITLWVVIFWYFVLYRAGRQVSQDFLMRVDPSLKTRHWARLRLCYRHFLCFAETLVDKIAAWSGTIADQNLSGEGRANFRRALDSGRGGLVFVSHHGNLDVISALGENHPNLHLVVLMHTKNAGKFNTLLEKASQRRRPPIIETTEISPATAQYLARLLMAGGFVIIAADRVPQGSRRYLWLDFIGEKAPFPQGPFLLATLLRCPVYMATCVKQGQSFWIDFFCLGDTTDLPRSSRQQWIVDTAQQYADQLSFRAREYPLQWFNFFYFWRAPHADGSAGNDDGNHD